jgi:hypothetical protein
MMNDKVHPSIPHNIDRSSFCSYDGKFIVIEHTIYQSCTRYTVYDGNYCTVVGRSEARSECVNPFHVIDFW